MSHSTFLGGEKEGFCVVEDSSHDRTVVGQQSSQDTGMEQMNRNKACKCHLVVVLPGQ